MELGDNMSTPAITGLADLTLSANTSSINLTGFSSSYRDLIISLTWQNSGNSSAIRVRFNNTNDSNGVYDFATIFTNFTPTTSGFNADETSTRAFGVAAGPTNLWQTGVIKLYNYANSSRHKYMITRHSDANGDVALVGSRWESTAPITTILIYDVLGQTIQAGARLRVWGRI